MTYGTYIIMLKHPGQLRSAQEMKIYNDILKEKRKKVGMMTDRQAEEADQ